MLGESNSNSIERKLKNVTNGPEGLSDPGASPDQREK